MFCNQCGKKIKPGARTCSCGEPVESAQYCGGFWGLAGGRTLSEKASSRELSYQKRETEGPEGTQADVARTEPVGERSRGGSISKKLIGLGAVILTALLLCMGFMVIRSLTGNKAPEKATKETKKAEATTGDADIKGNTERLVEAEADRLYYRKLYSDQLLKEIRADYRDIQAADDKEKALAAAAADEEDPFRQKVETARKELDAVRLEREQFLAKNPDYTGDTRFAADTKEEEVCSWLLMSEVSLTALDYGLTKPAFDEKYGKEVMFANGGEKEALTDTDKELLEAAFTKYRQLPASGRNELVLGDRLLNLEVMLTDYYISILASVKQPYEELAGQEKAEYDDNYRRAKDHYDSLGDKAKYLRYEDELHVTEDTFNKVNGSTGGSTQSKSPETTEALQQDETRQTQGPVDGE